MWTAHLRQRSRPGGAHRDAIADALESIHHRGPDETGVTVSGDDVVLGFKRLSIIDVEHSHQPLAYADGRYVMTFNGEIYNYLELREQLVREHGAKFATDGDTEVIVAAYHYWGAEVGRPGCAACSRSSSGTGWTGARSAPATRSASSRCTTCETADGRVLRQREEGAAAVRAGRDAGRRGPRPGAACRTT